jgi:hypothetical protein
MTYDSNDNDKLVMILDLLIHRIDVNDIGREKQCI